jgi:hypothetical protein
MPLRVVQSSLTPIVCFSLSGVDKGSWPNTATFRAVFPVLSDPLPLNLSTKPHLTALLGDCSFAWWKNGGEFLKPSYGLPVLGTGLGLP